MKRNKLVLNYNPCHQVAQLCSELNLNIWSADSIKSTLELADSHNPDLVLFNYNSDISIKQISQLRLSAQFTKTPILCLFKDTPSPQTITEVIHAGADNFICLPTSPELLDAYMISLLRRKASYMSSTQLEFGDIRLDLNDNRGFKQDLDLDLTPIEFEILKELIQVTGQIVPRSELKKKSNIFGVNSDIALNVHVHAIRKKLKSYGPLLKTIRSKGYLINAPTEEAGQESQQKIS